MAQPLKVTERDHQAKKTSRIVDIVHRLYWVLRSRSLGWPLEALRSHSTVRSHVFRKLFMESVLLKAKFVKFMHSQYWLNLDGKKGMSDREGHGH